MTRLLDRVNDRTRFERRTALKPHPLVGTSLAPALTGGRGVGGVACHTSQGAGRVAFAAAGHPPEVPLTCESGARGVNGRQRRGRWLKKCSSEYPDQGASPIAPSKPVTALAVLERWRGFCGDRRTPECRVERVSELRVESRRRQSDSVSAEDQRRGGDAPRRSSHSSCELMICGRPRVPGTEARTQLRASV